jgi:hypothetical protein
MKLNDGLDLSFNEAWEGLIQRYGVNVGGFKTFFKSPDKKTVTLCVLTTSALRHLVEVNPILANPGFYGVVKVLNRIGEVEVEYYPPVVSLSPIEPFFHLLKYYSEMVSEDFGAIWFTESDPISEKYRQEVLNQLSKNMEVIQ